MVYNIYIKIYQKKLFFFLKEKDNNIFQTKSLEENILIYMYI